jgi:hypothetical protein
VQKFGAADIQRLADEVQFCIRNALHPECEMPMLARFYDDMSAARRGLAVLRLLLQADVYGFACELAYSGQARRHFLARYAKAAFADHNLIASRSDALFDAIAGGWIDLARDIAALSPKAFRPGDEYEDDFCYAHFFHDYLLGSPAPPMANLDRFEHALDGSSSPRLEICRAIVARDQRQFDAALTELIDLRQREVDEERVGVGDEDAAVAIGTYVFVEGLALLRVAESAGLKTQREYPLCPALARAIGHAIPPQDELPAV